MADPELTLRDILKRLPPGAEAVHVPAADLWSRIAAAHVARQHRRTWQRRGLFATGLAAALAGVLVVPAMWKTPAPAMDWQARAQALEVQLNTLAAQVSTGDAPELDAELARIDVALQAAYDRGAQTGELVPLWKQRSELLSTLLAARQQQLMLTRI